MDWVEIIKAKQFKPKCQNGPCLRIANGTDGIGFCMPCEDDASDNRLTDPKSPYTRKNQIKNPTLPNIYVGNEIKKYDVSREDFEKAYNAAQPLAKRIRNILVLLDKETNGIPKGGAGIDYKEMLSYLQSTVKDDSGESFADCISTMREYVETSDDRQAEIKMDKLWDSTNIKS